MSSKDLIVLFVNDCLERRMNKTTVSCYASDLVQVVRWFMKNIKPTPDSDKLLLEVTPEQIELQIQSLRPLYKTSTIARRVFALKNFFSWLCKEGKRDENPCEHIKKPKVVTTPPQVLTREQVARFMEAPTLSTIRGARDRAMFEVIYGSGLRVNELVALKRADVDLGQKTLRVSAPGRERVLPLTVPEVSAITAYFKKLASDSFYEALIRVTKPSALPLFFGKGSGRIGERSFRRRVKKYIKLSGIDTEVVPRLFRHSARAHLLDDGVNPDSLKQFLGLSTG